MLQKPRRLAEVLPQGKHPRVGDEQRRCSIKEALSNRLDPENRAIKAAFFFQFPQCCVAREFAFDRRNPWAGPTVLGTGHGAPERGEPIWLGAQLPQRPNRIPHCACTSFTENAYKGLFLCLHDLKQDFIMQLARFTAMSQYTVTRCTHQSRCQPTNRIRKLPNEGVRRR